MARSLIGGLIGKGVPADRLSVSEPNADLRAALARDFAIATPASNEDAAGIADGLLLAVKPQVMNTVCTGLRAAAQARKPLIISTAAGIRIDQLDAWLGGNMAVVRCMPNTPALIGAGATGACANARSHTPSASRTEDSERGSGNSVIDDEEPDGYRHRDFRIGARVFLPAGRSAGRRAVAQGLPRETARALATDLPRRRTHAARDGATRPNCASA